MIFFQLPRLVYSLPIFSPSLVCHKNTKESLATIRSNSEHNPGGRGRLGGGEGRRAKMAGNMRYGGRKEREEGEKLCHNHDEKGLQNSTLGEGLDRDRVRTIVERTDDGSRGAWAEGVRQRRRHDNHFGSRHCVTLYTSTLRFGDVT